MSREVTVKVKGKNGKEYVYKREVPLPKPRGRHPLVHKKLLRAEITKLSDMDCKKLLNILEQLKAREESKELSDLDDGIDESEDEDENEDLSENDDGVDESKDLSEDEEDESDDENL